MNTDVKVLNGKNEVSTFKADAYARALIEEGTSGEMALQTADSLAKVFAEMKADVVSEEALNTASKLILSNPKEADLNQIRKVFEENQPPMEDAFDLFPIAEFYESLARKVDGPIFDDPDYIMMASMDIVSTEGTRGRQDMILVGEKEGSIHEMTTGPINAVHELSPALSTQILDPTSLQISSVNQARSFFNVLNPMYNLEKQSAKNGTFSYVGLVNSTSFGGLAQGKLSYGPKWIGCVTDRDLAVISIVCARTAAVEFTITVSFASLVIFHPPLLNFNWVGTAWDVFVKLIAIVAGGIAIDVLIAGGLVSSPTVLGPLIAAVLIILILISMIKTVIDILLELTGDDNKSKVEDLLARLDKLLDKMEKLKDKLQKGEIDKDQGLDEIGDALEEAEEIEDDLEELTEGTEAENALEKLGDLKEIIGTALGG